MCHSVSTLLHSAIQPSITCDQVLNLRLFCWKWNYQFLISLWKWLVKSVCVHVTLSFSLLLLTILDDYRFLLLLNHQSRMNKQSLCVLFLLLLYIFYCFTWFGWCWLQRQNGEGVKLMMVKQTICFIKIVMYNIIRLYNTFKIYENNFKS